MNTSEMKNVKLILPQKKINLTGQKFGRLIVEKFNYWNGFYFWLCKCDCGELVSVREDSLITGNTHSCGCLQRDVASSKRYKDYPGTFNNLFSQYRNNAEKRNIEFSLSREIMYKVTQENCFYCGLPPKSIQKNRNGEIYIYSGLDRINNTLGYIETNIVPCCKNCNYAKKGMTLDDFYYWVNSIYNNLNNKLNGLQHNT